MTLSFQVQATLCCDSEAVVVGVRMTFIASDVCILGPQLVELLENVALLEEGGLSPGTFPG